MSLSEAPCEVGEAVEPPPETSSLRKPSGRRHRRKRADGRTRRRTVGQQRCSARRAAASPREAGHDRSLAAGSGVPPGRAHGVAPRRRERRKKARASSRSAQRRAGATPLAAVAADADMQPSPFRHRSTPRRSCRPRRPSFQRHRRRHGGEHRCDRPPRDHAIGERPRPVRKRFERRERERRRIRIRRLPSLPP